MNSTSKTRLSREEVLDLGRQVRDEMAKINVLFEKAFRDAEKKKLDKPPTRG